MKAGVALLDVNVLVALFDPSHVHHAAAHDWFADRGEEGWATCPLTENGLLRVLTHPRAGVEDDYQTLRAGLQKFCAARGHTFWPDAVSLHDDTLFDRSVVLTHRQLTDIYLLGLAVRMGGTLATFDARIASRAVRGARREHLTVIAAAE